MVLRLVVRQWAWKLCALSVPADVLRGGPSLPGLLHGSVCLFTFCSFYVILDFTSLMVFVRIALLHFKNTSKGAIRKMFSNYELILHLLLT